MKKGGSLTTLNPSLDMKTSLVKTAALLAATLWIVTAALGTPPSPPVQIHIELKPAEGDLSGGTLPLKVRLQTREQAAKATLTCHTGSAVRKAAQKLDKQFEQAVEIAAGRAAELSIPVKLPLPGSYTVDIKAVGKSASGGFSDRKILRVEVSEGGRYRIMLPAEAKAAEQAAKEQAFKEALAKNPDNPRLELLRSRTEKVTVPEQAIVPSIPKDRQALVRPAELDEATRKHIKDRRAESWKKTDPITIRGRFFFVDFAGITHPAPNVEIRVYDDDFFGDELLASVATGWDGRWEVSVNNDDGWFEDGRDIFYTARLENSRWKVQTGGGVYEWQSDHHNDRSEGSVVDFGSEQPGTDMEAAEVFNTLNLAWNHATTEGGRDPGHVAAKYPADGTFYSTFWNELSIEAEYNDGPDVIAHEYGHAIQHHAYGNQTFSPGGPHTFGDTTQDPKLSWSEGWATAFALNIRHDGSFNWHEGDGGQPIEAFSLSNREGEKNEGRVAAALLDLMDAANDNNGGDEDLGRNDSSDSNTGNTIPLSLILDGVLWGGSHETITEFWSSLSGELNGTRRTEARRVMNYNWMDVKAPEDKCVATKIAAQEARDPEALLTGLRLFRDHALRGFAGGREITAIYYRNSPEIAIALVKDAALRTRAMNVLDHFSRLGTAAASHKLHLALAGDPAPLVPDNIAAEISGLIEVLEKSGSPELKSDMAAVKQFLASIKGANWNTLQRKIQETEANAQPDKRPIRQSTLNPASSQALKQPALIEAIRKVTQ